MAYKIYSETGVFITEFDRLNWALFELMDMTKETNCPYELLDTDDVLVAWSRYEKYRVSRPEGWSLVWRKHD